MRLPNNKGLTTNNKHCLLQIFPGDRKKEQNTFFYVLDFNGIVFI